MTEALYLAYKNTVYKVFEPSVCIRIGEDNPKLKILLQQHEATQYAYLTAFNPYSQLLDHAENLKRHLQLKEALKAYPIYEGEGCGEDTDWPCERSYLVLGITKEKAIALGNQFGQHAIDVGHIDGLPELILLSRMDDSSPGVV